MILETGADWGSQVSNSFKNGTFFFKDGSTDNTIFANYNEVAAILDPIIYPEKEWIEVDIRVREDDLA
jgi:hypothetical protein